MKRRHSMPFGAEFRSSAEGGSGSQAVRFRLWAPSAKRVAVKIESPVAARREADLNPVGEGWYELEIDVGPNASYRYRIDDEIDVPDPASRFNPDGVQEASVIVDPANFEWSDQQWRGRAWNEAVIYEMHVGAFTPEGTYAAAIQRLDELAALGVTAIELLPLNAFLGRRGWGYDGVLLYAPHAAYGEPDDLKRFVQAAHARNLMVLLDVVYNHFGPEGNYLHRQAREFFTDRHHTPWGDAINFEHPIVRQFFIQNALYWLNEFHFDGLRIDAVHAMYDDSPKHFIDELVETVRQGPGVERCVHIVLENHHNEASRLEAGGDKRSPRRARRSQSNSEPDPEGAERSLSAVRCPLSASGIAQWNDDFHHALHVIVTDEKDGYYIDYAQQPLTHLGRILTEGFAYQGERSAFSNENRGQPSAHLPPTAFVNFLQNHDQIGNRAFGERIARLAAAPERLRAATAILLLAPQIPMLFMGEEYAAPQPFMYFCDYEGDLADAIRNGRRNEFAGFRAFSDERARDAIPDPNAAATFERSRLNWADREHAAHATQLDDVRAMLRIRAQHISPLITQIAPGKSSYDVRDDCLSAHWPLQDGSALLMVANLSNAKSSILPPRGELIYTTADQVSDKVGPWEVRVARESG